MLCVFKFFQGNLFIPLSWLYKVVFLFYPERVTKAPLKLHHQKIQRQTTIWSRLLKKMDIPMCSLTGTQQQRETTKMFNFWSVLYFWLFYRKNTYEGNSHLLVQAKTGTQSTIFLSLSGYCLCKLYFITRLDLRGRASVRTVRVLTYPLRLQFALP